MPKATVSHEHQRFDLKTCPGGFVVLRTLSFHEMMQRRDVSSKLWTEFTQQKRGKRNRDAPEEAMRAQLEVMNVAVMEFEFKNCIVEHNLEDDNGNQLDFNNPLTFKALDPKIGAEINRYIEDLTQEDEQDAGPLAKSVTSFLEDGETRQSQTTPVES